MFGRRKPELNINELNELIRRLMVSQSQIDASVARLTKAVDAVVAAGASTPDVAVTNALNAVDAQSARLEAVSSPAPGPTA